MADVKGGYGIVYRDIMRNRELTPEAKAIYAYLCSFAGAGESCYPGAELMRSELQMGTDRFYKHMHLLTDAGIVRKVQERKGNRWGNTLYVLNHTPDFQLSQNGSTEKQLSQNGSTQNQYTQNKYINNNSRNSNSINNNRSNNNYDQQVDRVYALMNKGRIRTASKGRLRKPSGDCYIQNLLRDGVSMEKIMEAAEQVGREPNAYWDELEEVIKQQEV